MFNNFGIYVYEFTIDEYFFPDKDYVLITTTDDDGAYEKMTNQFYVTNGLTSWFPNGFIVPQTIYESIIKPILARSFTEKIIHDNEEGGDN